MICLSASLHKRCFVGFIIGVALDVVIVSCMETSNMGDGAIWAQYLFSGLYGAACMGGTVLYKIEIWSLIKCTVLHWLITALLYVPVAWGLKWVDSLQALLLTEGIMLVVFLLIWSFMYLRWKVKIHRLNELINGKKGVLFSHFRLEEKGQWMKILKRPILFDIVLFDPLHIPEKLRFKGLIRIICYLR